MKKTEYCLDYRRGAIRILIKSIRYQGKSYNTICAHRRSMIHSTAFATRRVNTYEETATHERRHVRQTGPANRLNRQLDIIRSASPANAVRPTSLTRLSRALDDDDDGRLSSPR